MAKFCVSIEIIQERRMSFEIEDVEADDEAAAIEQVTRTFEHEGVEGLGDPYREDIEDEQLSDIYADKTGEDEEDAE
jgi:hypothetical protein